MSVEWDKAQWKRFISRTQSWWQRELDGPLVDVRVPVVPHDQVQHDLPYYPIAARYDDDVPAETIVERWDMELQRYRLLGDAYPGVWANFGATFLAALLGSDLEADENTTWLSVPEMEPIKKLQLAVDPENRWHQRYIAFCQAAADYWQGRVQVGMCTGGMLDVLAVFRPEGQLQLDMCDAPEHVERLINEAHQASWHYFQEVERILKPHNPGYSSWEGIFCAEPYQILVSDLCCTIGPAMFEQFVKPELESYTQRLSRSFYHLDGPDAVRHLDALLSLPRLDGIQWIWGAAMASRPLTEWTDLCRRILSADKLIQLFVSANRLHEFDALADALGTNRGFHLAVQGAKPEQSREIESFLRRHGALTGQGVG